MKKLLVFLGMLLLLPGCSGHDMKPGNNQMALVSATRLATAIYLEKNDAADTIINLNSAVQAMDYGMDVYTYSYVNLKNKIIQKNFTEDMTLAEKEGCIFVADLIFGLILQEYQADQFYLVDPEALDMIKVLFANAADVAKTHEEK